jgi:flagellin
MKENLSNSESSIRDLDVAAEMTTYTKLQVMQQAGMAMLGQANQSGQSVLSLLKG